MQACIHVKQCTTASALELRKLAAAPRCSAAWQVLQNSQSDSASLQLSFCCLLVLQTRQRKLALTLSTHFVNLRTQLRKNRQVSAVPAAQASASLQRPSWQQEKIQQAKPAQKGQRKRTCLPFVFTFRCSCSRTAFAG
jgi:hypothetical protein